MERFENRIAVVTGGGSGMGRELVRQLAAEGCHVAMCDVGEEAMSETRDLALGAAPDGTRVTTFVADVSDESQVVAFRDAVARDLATDRLHLLFNNAGVGGGGSLFGDTREEWDRTFAICWGGVYYSTRAFLPMLVAADEARIVNTSSVNGFWASIGPMVPHTAYSTAKFAVKGFSEALIADLRVNAPHVSVSVVMPGHIGTGIVFNSARILGRDLKEMDEEQIAQLRARLDAGGIDLSGVSDEDLRTGMIARAQAFQDAAPLSAEGAAAVILEGVRNGRWRILVGDDAHRLDERVRADPERAYEPDFFPDFINI